MVEFDNKLTSAQKELLAIITEETGEVLQAIGKIERHGLHSVNPDNPHQGTNRDVLEKEMGDLLSAFRLAYSILVSYGDVDISMHNHLHKLKKSVHDSDLRAILEEETSTSTINTNYEVVQ